MVRQPTPRVLYHPLPRECLVLLSSACLCLVDTQGSHSTTHYTVLVRETIATRCLHFRGKRRRGQLVSTLTLLRGSGQPDIPKIYIVDQAPVTT